MPTADLGQTSKHWDSDPWNTGQVMFWLQHPSVQRRLAIKESDRSDSNWIAHTLETHFAARLPLARCLSLGCGRGQVEREWAARQAFLACDAYDISPASIADAAAAADADGCTSIHFAVADINQLELPPQTYDAVWAVGSAHHFSALERIFAQVARTLKPGGLFILHEYIGANRFQFDARQRQVIEACLHLLPIPYRLLPAAPEAPAASTPLLRRRDATWIVRRMLDKVREGTLWSTVGRYWRRRQAIAAGRRPIREGALPTLRSVIAVDPSEAVRSAEIMPVLQTMFDVVEFRPLGGAILQFLLADIAGNFETEDGERLLQMLFTIEDTLMATGDLPSDFAYIVAAPRRSTT
jgi:SAM-dependent methyltransferase